MLRVDSGCDQSVKVTFPGHPRHGELGCVLAVDNRGGGLAEVVMDRDQITEFIPLIADETPEDDFLASSVEVGAHGACALYNDSDIRCWGRNLRDRVGDPSANHAVEANLGVGGGGHIIMVLQFSGTLLQQITAII